MIRFNGYPAADILGEADPRMLSSAEAMAKVNEIAATALPAGMGIDWSDLSYQEATQGKAALVVFPLAVLLAFLVLAALYESWTLPLAVILIVPMTLLSALLGVWLTGGDNNVFVQVGLVVLMGLACKNAILIVEFARELEMQGKGIVEAALEACRLRLRPIVMTSVAFIAGTVPLVLSHGAGAEVRSVTGITVFAGMLGVTLFGLFLTPVFYVALRKLAGRPLVAARRVLAPAIARGAGLRRKQEPDSAARRHDGIYRLHGRRQPVAPVLITTHQESEHHMSNTSKTALVTGATRGIGFETVRQLAQAGVHTLLAGRDRAKAVEAALKLQAEGLPVEAIVLDVTDAASIAAAADEVAKKFGRLDILVNNAGIMRDEPARRFPSRPCRPGARPSTPMSSA